MKTRKDQAPDRANGAIAGHSVGVVAAAAVVVVVVVVVVADEFDH